MKKFLRILWMPIKWFWKFLTVGITAFTTLIFITFTTLILTQLFYSPALELQDNTILILNLEGDITEKRSPIDPMSRMFNNLAGIPLERKIHLQDTIDAIYTAADDPSISAMFINPGKLGKAGLGRYLRQC